MDQIKLQNKTGRRVTNGELVRLFPGTTTAFIVAKLNEFGIIGTVSGTIETGQIGTINLINTVSFGDVIKTPTTLGGYGITDGGAGMTYPAAGIALSDGSAWLGSIANNSANWNTAYGWGDHAGLYLALHGTADNSALLDNHNAAYFQIAGAYQPQLNGTGFVKASGTTISYDNSTYLTSLSGAILVSQAAPQTIGSTTERLTKLWAINAELTNLPTINGGTLATALNLGSAAYTASTAYDVAGAAAAVTPTTLGLVIGTNVQAYNANLTAINQALTTTSSPSFTAVGATTFTGALTGHASSDALVGQTFYIGTTQVAINRASAALTLAGITLTTPILGTPTSGTLTNCTFPTLNQNTTGNAATVTTNANLTGPVTSVGNATTITDSAVTLAKMADMATASLIYRKTAGAGVPEVNTLATLKTDLGLTGTNSGDNGTVTSVAALTIGTTGTDLSSTVATGTTTPVITLQVPTASASNRGVLSAANWTTFNNKAPALSGTTNYVSKFTDASTLGNSLIYDNGTGVGIGTTSPRSTLEVDKATGVTTYAATDMDLQIVGGATGVNKRASIGFGYNNVNQIPAMISYKVTAGGGNTAGELGFWTRSVTTDTAPTQRMVIQSGGNVGIGTTSPNEALTLGADGVLSIDERAAAPSATAAYGKLWVKTATPNELWFTDDAGTSTKIA